MALVDNGLEILLALHDGFRTALDDLVDDLGAKSDIGADWRQFTDGLRSHHRHEEDEIYPQVRAVLGSGAVATLDAMDAEHAALVSALDRADRSLGANDPDAAVANMAALRAVLRDHLAHEEAAAVPLIRRSLDDNFMRAFFSRRQAELAATADPVH